MNRLQAAANKLSVCIVVKITLNQYDRSSLVSRSARQVAERADEVGQLTRSRTLRCHVADKAARLLANAVRYSLLQLLARQILEIVVREIFQLQLVRRADETVGVCRRNDRVGKLPDLALRVLERAVAVDHDLDVLAGRIEYALLNLEHEVAALAREELDLILGRLVRAEQSVFFIAAAAVHRSVHYLVKTAYDLRAGFEQNALSALAGVNVAVDDVVGVAKYSLRLICEDNLNLRAAGFDEIAVVFDIVDAGELMYRLAEQLAVTLKREYVAVLFDFLVKNY